MQRKPGGFRPTGFKRKLCSGHQILRDVCHNRTMRCSDIPLFNRNVFMHTQRSRRMFAASCIALVAMLPSCARVAHEPAVSVANADAAQIAKLQQLADSIRTARRFPGLSLAVALADGSIAAVTSGYADTTARVALKTSDKLMQGSVGKTYVAAVAMQLVAEGKLDIDAPIARYLDNVTWLDRIAHARTITVRQIMNHTSGLVRYEFQPQVTAVLRANPYKVWTPEERLAALFDAKPPFAPGEGWEYSDTNYIVLGMIIERITGRTYYSEMQRRLLQPLALRNTIPSDQPELPGLANGYAGLRNDLGGYDASIGADGRFAINPQFEWTGGGIASTTGDLARWAKLLYEGGAFPVALVPRMVDGVPSRLGQNVRYGLGVIVRDTPLGPAWGHSGFFPGYATEMMYFPDLRMSAAVQVNTSSPYPSGLPAILQTSVRAMR